MNEKKFMFLESVIVQEKRYLKDYYNNKKESSVYIFPINNIIESVGLCD